MGGDRLMAKPKRIPGWTWAGPNTINAINARQMGFTVPPATPHAPAAAPAQINTGLAAHHTAPAPSPAPLLDDAQAAAARAQALFDRTQSLAGLQQQGIYDANDLAEARRRLLEQQPKDEQAAKEAANRQGLFYSGVLGKQLGDIETSYARQIADQQAAYARREAARLAAIDALKQGAPLSDAAITADEIGRQETRDAATAAAGGLAPPASTTTATPAPTSPSPAAAPLVLSGYDSRGHKGEWHIYPGGRKVFVRKGA